SASGTEAYVKNILYNEHGQRTEIDYGNNVVTKYAYDDENLRLKTIETTKGGRTIQSLTYDYDTRDEAKKAVFEYIELFYNRVRQHSKNGYVPPLEMM
ncbi:MAG TPA: IS3 family transposase, partial [Spirochaetota bacterium]|nr:IS3 family transposase [Spirochaetota bacterium]